VEWINVALIVNMLMNFWVVQNTGNFMTTWATVSFLIRALFHEVN
jgi:hypothetical protein